MHCLPTTRAKQGRDGRPSLTSPRNTDAPTDAFANTSAPSPQEGIAAIIATSGFQQIRVGMSPQCTRNLNAFSSARGNKSSQAFDTQVALATSRFTGSSAHESQVRRHFIRIGQTTGPSKSL